MSLESSALNLDVIYAPYVDLTITGSGSLTIDAQGSNDNGYAAGIDCQSYTQESGSVTITSGGAKNLTCMSVAGGDLIVNGGLLSATSGNASSATNSSSIALSLFGHLDVNGGEIHATAGDADNESTGIFAFMNHRLNTVTGSGKIYAQSGDVGINGVSAAFNDYSFRIRNCKVVGGANSTESRELIYRDDYYVDKETKVIAKYAEFSYEADPLAYSDQLILGKYGGSGNGDGVWSLFKNKSFPNEPFEEYDENLGTWNVTSEVIDDIEYVTLELNNFNYSAELERSFMDALQIWGYKNTEFIIKINGSNNISSNNGNALYIWGASESYHCKVVIEEASDNATLNLSGYDYGVYLNNFYTLEIKSGEVNAVSTCKTPDQNVDNAIGLGMYKVNGKLILSGGNLSSKGHRAAMVNEGGNFSVTTNVLTKAGSEYDGSDAEKTTVANFKQNMVDYRYFTMEEIDPESIAVGAQSGTLTYGDTTSSANFAVTPSNFETDPTSYGVVWCDKDGNNESTTAPSGITLSVDGAIADGKCSYKASISATVDVDDYYFKITHGSEESRVTSSAVKLTVSKATWTDDAPSFTANIDINNPTDGTVTATDFFETLPAGAKIKSVSGTAANVLSAAPTVNDGVLFYTPKASIAKDATDNFTVTIESKNYTDITNAEINFVGKDKTVVDISGVQLTGVTGTPVPSKIYNGQSNISYTTNGFSVKVRDDDSTPNPAIGVADCDFKWYKSGEATPLLSPPKAAGSYSLKVSVKTSNAKYLGESEYPFIITKKAVSVKPNDASILKGAAMPSFKLDMTGFISGDDVDLSAASTFKVFEKGTANEVQNTNTAGTYDIKWTNEAATNFIGDDKDNYAITKSDTATLTINNPPTPPIGGGDDKTKYTVTFDYDGGTGTEASREVEENAAVGALPEATKEGFELLGWYTAKNGGGTKYTNTTVITANIKLFAHWKDNGANTAAKQFTDIQGGEWFYDAIDYVYQNELFSGVDDDKFAPKSKMTRAMFVTVMGRLAEQMGEKTTGYTSSFTDVPSGVWYSDYIAWASAKNIVGGYNDSTFGTNDLVSREDMAVLLVRFANYMKIDLPKGDEKTFSDTSAAANYATEAIGIAAEAGIINGYDDGSFLPKRTSQRAEVAQVFYNLGNID